MKRLCLSLLVLTFLLAAGSLPAQTDDVQTCVVVLSGQNRNRTVAGMIDVECGTVTPIVGHSAPFGNWGVASNYGQIRDTDQFRGWSHEDGPTTKRQWNSCTSFYPPPDCDHYNTPPGICRTQSSPSPVTHGTMVYRSTFETCDPTNVPGKTPTTYIGCQQEGGTVSQSSNYMTLYELDGWKSQYSGDGHDLVETLYFPGTSVTLTGCNYYGCPEKTSAWVDDDEDRDTSPLAHVDAQLRMTGRAYLEGTCGWTPPTTTPVIDSFTASPPTITAGESATLRWTTEGADSAAIDQGVGSVTPLAAGSVSVSPAATTKYTITATKGKGDDVVNVDRHGDHHRYCSPEAGTMSRASSLHFSPRGEAKWVRGPSGRGARRPRQQYGPLAFHESRDTNHGLQGFSLKTDH